MSTLVTVGAAGDSVPAVTRRIFSEDAHDHHDDHRLSAQGEGNREHLDSAVRRNEARRAHVASRGCGGRSRSGPPRISPLPQARRHACARCADAPLFRRPRLCRDPRRHARQWRLRRADAGRIRQAGTGRRAGGDRLDRQAEMVLRQGRHVRHFLGRLQRAAGGGAEAPGAEGHRHHLLHRRPLRGRRPLQGRHRAQRDAGLGRHHAGLFLAPARPQDRRQPLAQDVDGAAGERALPRHPLARAPAPRRLLEARLGLRGLRRRRGADPGGGRLERRLFQRRAAADEGPARHAQGHHRAVGAQVSAFRRARTAHRLPAGVPCAGGTSG